MNHIYHGDALTILKTLDSESVDCCITSPPYWGLRDYGNPAQIGLEKTPEEYVERLVEVFREVRRVLKDKGTCWLNLGDSYAAHKDCKQVSQTLAVGTKSEQACVLSKGNSPTRDSRVLKSIGLKNKDLCGIPWRVAFALQADGWWLRQDIIWHKPNPMPESVTDRCTKAHEYIFLLSKSAKYYYNQEAIKEPSIDKESYTGRRKRNAPTMANFDIKNLKNAGSIQEDGTLTSGQIYTNRNLRSVWTVNTHPTPEAHFATFPEKLIEPMIKAGCPEGGTVLDPFIGSGTTMRVANRLRRECIGIDLGYEDIQKKRISNIQVELHYEEA